MIKKIIPALVLSLPVWFAFQSPCVRAQGTAFTYQGQLTAGGSPASGSYNLAFTLYATNATGSAIAGPVTNSAVAVSNGLFTTTVDFGGVFTGMSNWLQIAVCTNGSNLFNTLTPRQQLTPMPYAITAENLSGTIMSAGLAGAYANALAFNNASNVFTGSFAGNGANVTNVNAASLGGITAANFWQLSGNNVGAGEFIGSTNNQPVELWVNDLRGFRLEPTADVGPSYSKVVNVLGGSAANYIAPGTHGSVIGGGGSASYGGNGPPCCTTLIGGSNSIFADLSFLGGGGNNSIQSGAGSSVLAGGQNNSLASAYSFIGGGQSVFILNNSDDSVLVGGLGNEIFNTAIASFLGGGDGNNIYPGANNATLGGGELNTISGAYATVPGGQNNNANGQYSLAAGQQANANFQGDFVWADSQNAPFGSTANDQFLVRAARGVGINTSSPSNSLSVAGNADFSGRVGIGTNSPGAQVDIVGGNGNNQGIRLHNTSIAGGHFWNIHIDASGDALVFSHDNQWPSVNYSYLTPTSAGLITTSDRRVKKDIAAMPSCLDRVMALTPSTFRYEQADEDSPVNYGFIAQDVEQQFPDLVQERNGLKTLAGAGLTAINTRAIQDLDQKIEGRSQQDETRIQNLEREAKQKDARIGELEKQLNELGTVVQKLQELAEPKLNNQRTE